MIIEPKIRGFICTTSHPIGCEAQIRQQIDYVKKHGEISGAKNCLIIGASTGYGLSSRIVNAFGAGSKTLGVFYERPSEKGRLASPGWYQSVSFDKIANAEGLYAKSINGDAFTDEIKNLTLETIKTDLGQVDLVIYSLAAPRRQHPKTGLVSKSVLKPKDIPYTNKTLDFNSGIVSNITIEPATAEEISQTIDVMGGEDWEMWIDALQAANLLAPNALTIAYSYIGPEVTHAVYRHGTIGSAKAHLEATALRLQKKLAATGGNAYVSVNKALVTQASSAIPFMPLYISLLYKIMKEKNVHEGCLEQMQRMFQDKVFTGKTIPVDAEGRIRMDEWEMREDVQAEVKNLWQTVATENLAQLSDAKGYRDEFLKLFGFGILGVDYSADVPEDKL